MARRIAIAAQPATFLDGIALSSLLRGGSAFPFKSVYCDESGNSGANLIDEQQPCYVLAGVLGSSNDDEWLAQILDDLRRDHRLEGAELKGSKLLERARGWELVNDLLLAIRERGLVVYNLVEKRYAVAAKVVETYLDPLYNSRVGNEFTFDADWKQDLADAICELPTSTLHDFARAYRAREAPALLASLDALCAALRQRDRTDISILLAGSRRTIGEIAEAEKSADDGEIPGAGMPSLNLPIFADFLYQLEELGRASHSKRIAIVHDESKEFGPTFRWWFLKMRGAARLKETLRLSNGRTLPLPLQVLHSFKTIPSHESVGVQIADLIARALCLPAICCVQGRPIPPEAYPALQVLFLGLLRSPQLGGIMASKSLRQQLLGPVIGSIKDSKLDLLARGVSRKERSHRRGSSSPRPDPSDHSG